MENLDKTELEKITTKVALGLENRRTDLTLFTIDNLKASAAKLTQVASSLSQGTQVWSYVLSNTSMPPLLFTHNDT